MDILILKRLFFICPYCNHINRLSHIKIYDKDLGLENETTFYDEADQLLEEYNELTQYYKDHIKILKVDSALKGKQEILSQVTEIDKVLSPHGINPFDAKLVVNNSYIDFIVFEGISEGKINKIKLVQIGDKKELDIESKNLNFIEYRV